MLAKILQDLYSFLCGHMQSINPTLSASYERNDWTSEVKVKNYFE